MSKLRFMYGVGIALWLVNAILFLVIPEVEVPEQKDVEVIQPIPKKTVTLVVPEQVQPDPTEITLVREEIPLDAETQMLLYQASEETGIPFELALAVIWQETDFRNMVGDSGDSVGYMQVQPRWHRSRMERLGITDLADPYGNFLVGCDYLAELIEKNRGLEWALHAYNGGPTYANAMAKAGKVSQYAASILSYMKDLRGGN